MEEMNLKSSSAAASEVFHRRAGSAGGLVDISRKLCRRLARSGARPPLYAACAASPDCASSCMPAHHSCS